LAIPASAPQLIPLPSLEVEIHNSSKCVWSGPSAGRSNLLIKAGWGLRERQAVSTMTATLPSLFPPRSIVMLIIYKVLKIFKTIFIITLLLYLGVHRDIYKSAYNVS
jgi:hypothetical protein